MLGKKTSNNSKSRRSQQGRKSRKLQLEKMCKREMLAADLGLVDEGLQGELLSSMQTSVNQAVFSQEAPLIGNQLAEAGGPGQFLTELKDDLATLQLESGVSVADTQAALAQALEGKIAETGITVTENADSTEVLFQIPVRFTKQALGDADLGLGNDSTVDVLLNNEDSVDVNLVYELDLQFGVRELNDGSSEFFFVTDEADEITVRVDAALQENFGHGDAGTAKGKMGVFIGEFRAKDSDSSFTGTYTIDLQDPNQDGFLVSSEFADVSSSGKLTGNGLVRLHAEGSFLPTVEGLSRDSLFNLAVTNVVEVNYNFVDATTQGTNSPEQVAVDIEFQDTRLDLGTFYRDFVDPLLTSIRDVMMPVKPMVDFLTDPIPGLAQFTDLTFLDVAEKAAEKLPDSKGRDEALRNIDRAQTVIGLMNRLLDYKTPGTGDLNDTTKNLGNVKANFEHKFGEQKKQDERSKLEQLKNITHEQKESDKKRTKFEADFEGDISMPLFSQGDTLIRLLQGDASTSLVTADLNFDLSAIKYEYTAPIAALAFLANGEFRFELTAGLDLGIGFDARGIADFTDSLDFTDMEAFEESKRQNSFLLDRGFYVDDNNPHQVEDGNVSQIVSAATEQPEAYVRAKASVGGSLGPDWKVLTAKAGLLGTLSADINVDLNDLPDTLRQSEWVDPMTPTRPSDPEGWTYDGHIRLDEINQIIDYDPASLINASGQLVIGADAFAQVSIAGLDLIDVETTLVEMPLVDFNIAKPNDADIIENQKTDVVLGAMDQSGNLVVHAGASASLRQGIDATPTSAADENFRVRSLGEDEHGHRVQVIYWFKQGGVRKSFSQTFEGVQNVTIDAGSGDDQLVAEPGTMVPVHFIGGSGNDTLVGGKVSDVLEGSSGEDEIRGGSGDDTIRGGSGDDNLFGGTGGDSIYGDEGDDNIYGESGADFAYGGDGEDTIRGGTGNDMLRGGNHDDVIHGEEHSDVLFGDAGEDWLHGDSISNFITQAPRSQGAGHDEIHGGTSDDKLQGGFGNDELNGDSGKDELWGQGGSDHLKGGSGDDELNGDYSDVVNAFASSTGNDTLEGDSGNDRLRGGPGHDTLRGGDGEDKLYGQSGHDNLDGGNDNDLVYGDSVVTVGSGGADTVRGGAGDDKLHGGPGHDSMYGDSGADKIYGESGDDYVRGGTGNDKIYGDAVVNVTGGNDRLYGDDGDDSIHGGWGNDSIYGGNHNDYLQGDGGNDYVNGDGGNDRVYGGIGHDRLYGGSGHDKVYGSWGNDYLSGGSGNDYLSASFGDDRVYGGSGHDSIYGGWGSDRLYGDSGNDKMNGGLGKDRLYGGSGNDNLHGGRAAIDRDFAYDYLHGGSGYDTVNVSWYWFFGKKKEDRAVSAEKIV